MAAPPIAPVAKLVLYDSGVYADSFLVRGWSVGEVYQVGTLPMNKSFSKQMKTMSTCRFERYEAVDIGQQSCCPQKVEVSRELIAFRCFRCPRLGVVFIS